MAKPKDQQIVLPDPDLPMPEDEKNRGILGKNNAKDAKPVETRSDKYGVYSQPKSFGSYSSWGQK